SARPVDSVDRCHQRRDTIDHGGVDDLSLARLLRFEKSADYSEREVERAAAEVTAEIERWNRCVSRTADTIEPAGERDIVDVVPSGMGERTFLPPSGHAAIDEPRVALQAIVRAESEPLGDAGAVTFDQRVGFFDQAEQSFSGFWTLQIEGDRAA